MLSRCRTHIHIFYSRIRTNHMNCVSAHHSFDARGFFVKFGGKEGDLKGSNAKAGHIRLGDLTFFDDLATRKLKWPHRHTRICKKYCL